jgi:hypothetical protein
MTAHSTGLGQVFFDCFPPEGLPTWSPEGAQRAATAWRPGGAPGNAAICGPSCLGWQDGASCAVFCWTGSLSPGKVFLDTIQPVCLCNDPTPPSWN